MPAYQTLPAGAARGEGRDLHPIINEHNLPIGFSSNAGDVFIGVNSGSYASFTSRELTNDDDGYSLLCATAQVATVNTGLQVNFGCAFKGTITFDGTATVTDVRATGATNPWCSLIRTGADTYDVVGTKA